MPPDQSLSDFYSELPKLRTWVRFPSPAPEISLMLLALTGAISKFANQLSGLHGVASDFLLFVKLFLRIRVQLDALQFLDLCDGDGVSSVSRECRPACLHILSYKRHHLFTLVGIGHVL